MKVDIFLQKTSNMFVENRLLKFVVVVLTIAVVINSLLVQRAITYQRTVLIPPKMTGTIEFVQGRPTDDYLRDLTRRIVNLGATYSPATARRQFEELLSFYPPEEYSTASSTWYTLAGRVEDVQASTVFYPQKISVNSDIIEVTGTHRQWAGDQMVESGNRAYVIRYRIEDGRFYLLSFMEKWQAQESRRP